LVPIFLKKISIFSLVSIADVKKGANGDRPGFWKSTPKSRNFIVYFPETHRRPSKIQHENMPLAETLPSAARPSNRDGNVCFGKTENPKILPFDKFFILSYRLSH
jgi:hypothetical protein